MRDQLPLHGVLVLEFASVLAGPLVGQFLAELGARVIKLENARTNGDVTRSWRSAAESSVSDISAYFSCANFSKQSVVVDLTSEDDRSFCSTLVSRADILLHNWRSGEATKFGLDYEQCRERNPRIICASISGYGESSSRVGYDAIVQAESGFMDINGAPGHDATKLPVALMDVLAAHQLKEALLVSLLERERNGHGANVHVSLLDSALGSLVNQGTNFLNTGEVPRRQGSEHPNIVPYGTLMHTRDAVPLILAVGTDEQYKNLCEILGIEIPDRHRRNHDRVRHRSEVVNIIRAAIAGVEADDFLRACHTRRVPAGRLRTVAESLSAKEANTMVCEDDGVRGLRGIAFTSSAFASTVLTRPPHLDEHGDAVRQEFHEC